MGRLIRSSEFDGANNLIQRIEQLYDKANRLEQQSWVIDGDSYSESYTYNDPVVGADASVRPQDGSLASVTTATGDKILYTYESLKRLGGTTVENAAGEPLFRTGYSYKAGTASNQTTNQVLVYTTWNPNYTNLLSYRYRYDAVGNIIKIEDVTNTARTLAEYTYDELNQLTQEKIYNYTGTSATPTSTDTYVYTYDTAGNILTEKKNGTTVNTYSYSTGPWTDMLTRAGGMTISYDGAGNPLNYYNGEKSYTNLTWAQGRQLASLTTSGKTYTYGYDADGIRTQKVVDGVTHTYVTQNGRVMRETIGSGATAKVLDFIYDNNGKPFALIYTNGTATPQTYYYVLNLQGDVVALMTDSREIVAQYAYNAWGEILSATGTMAEINPLRYRGYYYDTETGFYYLQSRYYDPANCRWISSEPNAFVGEFDAGAGILAYNVYTYCANNPVMHRDDGGESITITIAGITIGIKGLISLVCCTTIVVAYACDEGFRDAWNTAVLSAGSALIRGFEALGGAISDSAIWLGAQAKVIADTIAESFAKSKSAPNYRSDKEVHHIVAVRAPNAKYAREVLEAVGLGINSPENLLLIKTGLHRRLHTNLYYGWANSVIISAYNSAGDNLDKQRAYVRSALATIRGFLLVLDKVAPY